MKQTATTTLTGKCGLRCEEIYYNTGMLWCVCVCVFFSSNLHTALIVCVSHNIVCFQTSVCDDLTWHWSCSSRQHVCLKGESCPPSTHIPNTAWQTPTPTPEPPSGNHTNDLLLVNKSEM